MFRLGLDHVGVPPRHRPTHNVATVSTPHDFRRRMRRRARVVRLVSLTLAGLAAVGLVGLNPAGQEPADAAAATSSELTINWTGDTSTAAKYQPIRDPKSLHFAEMKDLSITVSQTQGVVDQAVKVSVAGFAVGTGTRASAAADIQVTNGMNYLQAMQCYGDPLSAKFRESCQWGGRYVENNGLGYSSLIDNTLRVASRDLDPASADSFDNPFVTAQGRAVSGKPRVVDGNLKYEILDYFTPATSNEVTSARVGVLGTGSFDFETQTADQAPQLGCGLPESLSCWIVVVPRGTVFGGNDVTGGVNDEKCSSIRDPANGYEPYVRGRPNSLQGGSPVNPNCDYWDNRVVVPITFAPVGSGCELGKSEQRVIGSQLMVGAMSSWQPDLCARLKTTYSFSTNPDAVARQQILEGTATAGFTSFPLTPGELGSNDDRQILAETTLAYAPVAISGVSIAYLAELGAGRETSLNLSPRLVAKLLTQSYPFQIPTNSSDTPDKAIAHLAARNRELRFFNQDPEFQALNPSNWRAFSQNPGVVLPGPAGADAIRQVWRWILADKDATAFLAGTADGSGLKVNPYYLPAGHPDAVVPTFSPAGDYLLSPDGQRLTKPVGLKNIDGSPLKLAEANLESFLKEDKTTAPFVLQPGQKNRFDSIQFAPYTDNLLSSARLAFRADPKSRSTWDPSKVNSAGEVGDWVSSGAQVPGQKFMLAITDTPSASRYGLEAAALQVPNSTAMVQPDEATFATALSALQPTAIPDVLQVDPGKVSPAGYPLTTVTYAAVNLSRSGASNRAAIANLIEQVTTTGQIPGTAPGQLPAGYLSVTGSMAKEAATSVAVIRAYVEPTLPAGPTGGSAGPTNGPAQDSYEAPPSAGGANGATAAGIDPVVAVGAAVEGEAGATEDAAVGSLARSGLAVSLGVGLGGALFGPLLFRGRGFV